MKCNSETQLQLFRQTHKEKSILSKDEIISYSSMLDFAENYSYSPADFEKWKGKLLILESETARAFDNLQKKALKDLFPAAAVHTFKDSGHLTIITDQEEFMKVMKDFLEN